MEKEGELELTPEEERILVRKKTKAVIGIPYKLRFPLAWTLIFVIIGIVIQSIQLEAFVFIEFFIQNYFQWFRDFGSFVSPTAYATVQDLFFSIMSRWYYFFYTGGLISIIWALISLILNAELKITDKEKIPVKKKEEPKEKKEIPVVATHGSKTYHKSGCITVRGKENLVRFANEEQARYNNMKSCSVCFPEKSVGQLIFQAKSLIEQDKKDEARKIYLELQKKYLPEKDPEQKQYKEILEIYKKLS